MQSFQEQQEEIRKTSSEINANKQKKAKMGKTGDFFKKIGEIKGTFHLRMSTIMDRNGKELREAKEIKNIQKTIQGGS